VNTFGQAYYHHHQARILSYREVGYDEYSIEISCQKNARSFTSTLFQWRDERIIARKVPQVWGKVIVTSQSIRYRRLNTFFSTHPTSLVYIAYHWTGLVLDPGVALLSCALDVTLCLTIAIHCQPLPDIHCHSTAFLSFFYFSIYLVSGRRSQHPTDEPASVLARFFSCTSSSFTNDNLLRRTRGPP